MGTQLKETGDDEDSGTADRDIEVERLAEQDIENQMESDDTCRDRLSS